MGDIKNYRKERAKRQETVEKQDKPINYKERIRRRRRVNFYRFLLVLLFVLFVFAIVIVQFRRHVYTEYEVVNSYEIETATTAKDIILGKNIFTYSKDGMHCTDLSGNVVWNQTFQMQDIMVETCQNTVAIASYNGREIYVANSEKLLSTISTTMPIKNIAVAANGYVSAVLDSDDAAMIYTYDEKGELKYKGQARMNDSGYPAAIALSPNGELLSVSYWYLDAGVIKTRIAFYNLGPVGSNNSDMMVSAQNYTDILIPQVSFMNNGTAFAVGDNRLMIYSGEHKPVSKGECMIDREIKSVFYSDKYIGLVFESEDLEHLYELEVYNANAEKVGTFNLDMEYTNILFDQDNIIVCNNSKMCITTIKNLQKFDGSFHDNIRLVIPTGKAYKYALVTGDSIDIVQLK